MADVAQQCLFIFDEPDATKTYRALRHDVVRQRQKDNCVTAHHPDEKASQVRRVLDGHQNLTILELFAGRGNLTAVYKDFGLVDAFDRTYLQTGDSYRIFHGLIASGKKYHVVDLDPYGFPTRFMPDVFLLLDSGFLFVTMPKPYVNILNGITQTHLTSYFGEPNPNEGTMIERFATWGLCHWRQVELIECLNLKSVWRLAFAVQKVKATEYTGVKNR